MRTFLLVLCLALCGCPPGGILPAISAAMQGSQWMGTLLDVATAGAQAYYARHPRPEDEDKVQAAIDRTRMALAALDAAAATAKAADDGDLAKARAAALSSYSELRGLLGALGVLEARVPAGGAETDADMPLPLVLPTASDVESAM